MDFVNYVCTDKIYKFSSTYDLKNNVLMPMASETLVIITNELADAQAVRITTDGWLSGSSNSFESVTVHFIKDTGKTFKLRPCVLGLIPIERAVAVLYIQIYIASFFKQEINKKG